MRKINHLKYFLTSKIPVYKAEKSYGSPIIFGLLVFMILFIFQPFGMQEIKGNKLFMFSVYGLITFMCMFLKNKIFKGNQTHITILGILLNFLVIFPITILNWLYTKLIAPQAPAFSEMILFTIIIGFFIFIPLLILSLFLYYKNQFLLLKSTIAPKIEKESQNKSINLQSNNKNEKIAFTPNNLLYIKAEGNYSTFFTFENNEIKKNIYRITLKSFIESIEIQHKETFLRIQKSYIINVNYITNIEGNSHSPLIELNNFIKIPFSRNLYPELLQSFNNK